jgi:hypothetical protein
MTTSVGAAAIEKGHSSLEFFSLFAFLREMVVNEALGFDDLEIENPVLIVGTIGTGHDEAPFAARPDVQGMRGSRKTAFQASKTRARGALNTGVMTISRSAVADLRECSSSSARR